MKEYNLKNGDFAITLGYYEANAEADKANEESSFEAEEGVTVNINEEGTN